jgi:hypothetical protein
LCKIAQDSASKIAVQAGGFRAVIRENHGFEQLSSGRGKYVMTFNPKYLKISPQKGLTAGLPTG